MADHRDYKTAMGKILPREDWTADTLAKLRRAEAEKKAAAPPLRLAKKYAPPLAAAALLALAAPVLLRGGLWSAAGGAAAPEAAVQQAASAPAAAAYDAAGGTGDGETGSGESGGLQKSAAPARSFDLGQAGGLPVLVLGDDSGGMGGRAGELVAQSLDELRGNNPTWNLSAAELPATLPVWRAQSGGHAGPLADMLAQTADALGLPLVQDEAEDAPAGYPSPDLWPYSLYGSLMDPDHWDPDLALYEQLDPSRAKVWNISAMGTTVNAYRDGEGESADTRAGDEAALALLGRLAGIENPVWHASTHAGPDGGASTLEHFYYEGGGGSLTERLLNFCFRRVRGDLDGAGGLRHFTLTLPPESEKVGDYPLRSPEQAQAALLARLEEEQAAGLRDYPLTAADVAGWQLEYAQSSMNPYIQPVYRFYLKAPLAPEDTFYKDAEGEVYVSYTVSALPEEYCVPFEEAFN